VAVTSQGTFTLALYTTKMASIVVDIGFLRGMRKQIETILFDVATHKKSQAHKGTITEIG